VRLIAIVAVGVITATAGEAAAYPQFQLSTDNDRCSACHFAPSGGGLLNDYGRDESADTISGRGDGRFAHGAVTLPSWLALGADLRFALAGKQLDGDDPTALAFPMQGDVYTRVAFGPISLNLTAGLNGAARGRPAGALVTSYVASAEHYLMYQRGALSVRAGRLFPQLGLRSQDHTAYPRRYLDQYTLEEPYALEVGYDGATWTGAVAGFIGNPIPKTGAGPRASGATAYYERPIADGAATLGGQARLAVTDEDRRYTVGGIGKWWWAGPGLLAMAELDLQRQSFVDVDAARLQMVGYLGVTKMMLPGYMVGAAIQRWAPDLSLRGSTRNAVELDVQAFPWAHAELHLLTRVEATGGDTTTPNLLAMLQLHYYL
jgi:hypothetical protein